MSHGLGERPARSAPGIGGVFGASAGDIGFDAARLHRREIGFRQIAGVGGGLFRPPAEIGFNAIDQGRELAVIAHAGGEVVGDDDLGFAINGGLRVITLDVAILGLQDAAFRIGKIALRRPVGLIFWRLWRLAVLFASLSLALFLGLGLQAALFLRRSFGLGFKRGFGLADFGEPLLFVGDPVRQLIAAF